MYFRFMILLSMCSHISELVYFMVLGVSSCCVVCADYGSRKWDYTSNAGITKRKENISTNNFKTRNDDQSRYKYVVPCAEAFKSALRDAIYVCKKF